VKVYRRILTQNAKKNLVATVSGNFDILQFQERLELSGKVEKGHFFWEEIPSG